MISGVEYNGFRPGRAPAGGGCTEIEDSLEDDPGLKEPSIIFARSEVNPEDELLCGQVSSALRI
jgi:hypothetical protein